MDAETTLDELKKLVARFRDERDWRQFHNPKDLAISISIEANELLELFQWKSEAEVEALLHDPEKMGQIHAEIADIAIYVLSAADRLGFDLTQAVTDKVATNAAKYPVDKARPAPA